ncbi:1310_t:CDS:1, partial [Acaulospora morrowiae]
RNAKSREGTTWDFHCLAFERQPRLKFPVTTPKITSQSCPK